MIETIVGYSISCVLLLKIPRSSNPQPAKSLALQVSQVGEYPFAILSRFFSMSGSKFWEFKFCPYRQLCTQNKSLFLQGFVELAKLVCSHRIAKISTKNSTTIQLKLFPSSLHFTHICNSDPPMTGQQLSCIVIGLLIQIEDSKLCPFSSQLLGACFYIQCHLDISLLRLPYSRVVVRHPPLLGNCR